jgi:CotS family spore coat protein
MDISNDKLNAIIDSFKLGKLEQESNLRHVKKVTTDKGTYVIKRMRHKLENFIYSYQAVEHLNRKGFKNTCSYVINKEGVPYLIIDEEIYTINKWIDGGLADYDDFNDLKIVLNNLANLHKQSLGFKHYAQAEPRQKVLDWHERFKEKCDYLMTFKNIIQDKEKLTLFDKLYSNNLNYYYELGMKTIRMLDYTTYNEKLGEFKKQKGFCHHDLANHNVLICKNSVYFIDFDYVLVDIKHHDLASIIIRNMKDSQWNLQKAFYIIDCYSEQDKILDDDISIMKQFIRFPQDFWQVGMQYYIEKQPWDEDIFLNKLMKFLVQKGIREEFLNNFTGGRV